MQSRKMTLFSKLLEKGDIYMSETGDSFLPPKISERIIDLIRSGLVPATHQITSLIGILHPDYLSELDWFDLIKKSNPKLDDEEISDLIQTTLNYVFAYHLNFLENWNDIDTYIDLGVDVNGFTSKSKKYSVLNEMHSSGPVRKDVLEYLIEQYGLDINRVDDEENIFLWSYDEIDLNDLLSLGANFGDMPRSSQIHTIQQIIRRGDYNYAYSLILLVWKGGNNERK